MQIEYLSTGVFAVHGIENVYANNNVSAWYSRDGTMLFATAINSMTGKERNIPSRMVNVHESLKKFGKTFSLD